MAISPAAAALASFNTNVQALAQRVQGEQLAAGAASQIQQTPGQVGAVAVSPTSPGQDTSGKGHTGGHLGQNLDADA